jgi:hypothetical protein
MQPHQIERARPPLLIRSLIRDEAQKQPDDRDNASDRHRDQTPANAHSGDHIAARPQALNTSGQPCA